MIHRAINKSAGFAALALKWSVTFVLLAQLSLTPFMVNALAAQGATSKKQTKAAKKESTPKAATAPKRAPKAPPVANSSGAKARRPNAQREPKKISLRALELNRTPTEEELRMAGQLGSPLSPSASADHTRMADAGKRAKQESDNVLFGQAIQNWNQHKYPEAIKLFRKHRQEHGSSPWSGEAELHLGCAAQFSGSWDEAKSSFEWILANHEKGSDIYQKAKLRRSVLHIDQGQLEKATESFNEMLASETDWERRTYAQYWIRQISVFKAHEVALRDCGSKSLAYVLRDKGQVEKAREVGQTPAPGTRGFSLGELAEFAQKSGLRPAAVRAERSQLAQLSVPFIAHYSDQHFVVVTGFGAGDSVKLFDPRLDRATELTSEQFQKQWSGLALVFSTPAADIKLATITDLTREMGGCCGIPKYPNDQGPTHEPLDCNGMPAWEVNPVNMNLVVQDVPMWYNSEIGPKIAIEITYNSQDSLNQLRPFGNKWLFNYSSYAMESPGGAPAGSVLIVMPGGRGDTYQPDGVGGYVSPPKIFSTLTKLADYTFDLRLLDGTVYHYGVPAGMAGFSSLLLSIEDRNHNVVTVNHDTTGKITEVRDAQNRAWVMTYNTAGLVSRVDDPFGRNAMFSYDTNNNLTGQTDMGGLVYGYTYDTDVYLTSVAKPSGTTTFYIEPSAGTSAPEYPAPGGEMWENYRITVTDPAGFKEEYYYNGYYGYGWYRDKNQYQQGGSTAAAVNGPKTRYDYTVAGGQGVAASITYADGKTITYSNFDGNRLPQTITDENNHATQFTYNPTGRILTRADARNVSPLDEFVITYTYAPNADLLKVTDFFHDNANPALQLGYDANRNVATTTDGLGRTTTVVYNSFGQPNAVTDANNQVRTYNYNGLHQMTSVTQNGNTLLSVVPDAKGRPASVTNSNGYTLSYTYDDLDRLLRVIYPDATYVENRWGCCHLDGQRDRAGNFTSFGYNQVNRLISAVESGNRLTEYEYDAVGNLMKVIDPNRNATRWKYDQRGRVVQKIYADGTSYLYDYDGVGNQKHQTDAKRVQTTFDYDVVNNLTGVTAPGLAPISFAYDALNRRTQMSDGVGITTYAYNLANELTTIDGPWANDTITLSHDPLGRPTGRTIDGSNTNTVVYDNYGRPQTIINPLGTFTYNYPNSVSTLVSSVTSTGGPSTTFSYLDAAHDQRLGEIWYKDSTAQTISKFDYEHDALGKIKKWTEQTGAAAPQAFDFGYDSIGQLKNATLRDVSQAILKTYNYDYDAGGNRNLEAIDSLVTGDTGNNLNQLQTRLGGSGQLPIRGTTNESAASVTVNGNAATLKGDNTFEGKVPVTGGSNSVTVVATDLNGNVTTKSYNVVVTGSGSKTLVYDANGNLSADGARTFEWDPRNRLSAVSTGSHRSEFTYNGLNQRVTIVEKDNGAVTSTKNLLWNGTEICEERDTGNNVTKRYYGQGMQVGSTNYFYTRDHLGSIREVSDSAGMVQARYDYDAYGRRTKLAGNIDADFGFTGHYYHLPSALSFAFYRAYDAEFGRWISRDPIAETAGTNLYAYVRGDPVALSDPTGLMDCAGLQETLNRLRGELDRGSDALSHVLDFQYINNDELFLFDRQMDAITQLTGNLLGKAINSARLALTSERVRVGSSLGVDLARGGSLTGPDLAGADFRTAGIGGSLLGPFISNRIGSQIAKQSEHFARNWTSDGLRNSMQDSVNSFNDSLNSLSSQLRNLSHQYRDQCCQQR
jgi:RHS repeat-associated protein